jgi:adenylate cyclase
MSNTSRPRFTLAGLFWLMLISLSCLLSLYLALFLQASGRSIMKSAAALEAGAAQRAAALVENYLKGAERVIFDISREIDIGACSASSPEALEPCLAARLLEEPNVTEVALTHGERLGYSNDGEIELARPLDDRWQLSVFRKPMGAGFCVRTTRGNHGGFSAQLDCRALSSRLIDRPETSERAMTPDPTLHPTFTTPASQRFSGKTLWSDLSFSELDASLPEDKRRVVVNVIRAIDDREGRFVGVLRVALASETLDDDVRSVRVNETDPHDPYRVFLCDDAGRLVTRTTPEDRVQAFGEDLRVVPAHPTPEIARAVADSALAEIEDGTSFASGEFKRDGRKFYVGFRPLAHTQDWRVGVVGPQDYYLQDLRRTRSWMMAASVVLLVAVLLFGAMALRSIRRALGRIDRETARMRRFDFTPSSPQARFRDVSSTLDSLERAKTALRALEKYAPTELVRELYERNRDPVLGGELCELTLLFTDIRDFTSLAERLAPDRLAHLLGLYFEQMTAAIRANQGTVDKYIGDAVMAMWNAPRACADHPVRACAAALACVESTAKLFTSPAWTGAPLLETRFGLHTGEVMVGHFGAPDRLSFTALGDGVNLASRLEGLNKLYGTTILTSATIYERAKGKFDFRRLDRVAVKGRSTGVEVYELLGVRGTSRVRTDIVHAYERALDRYFERDFSGAGTLLAEHIDDRPSVVLLERCRRLQETPPSEEWDGTYVLLSK